MHVSRSAQIIFQILIQIIRLKNTLTFHDFTYIPCNQCNESAIIMHECMRIKQASLVMILYLGCYL